MPAFKIASEPVKAGGKRCAPGETVTLEAKTGAALVAAGLATEVKEPKAPKAATDGAAAAAAAAAGEQQQLPGA